MTVFRYDKPLKEGKCLKLYDKLSISGCVGNFTNFVLYYFLARGLC